MSTLLGFLGVGLAQLMSQLWTLVVLVLEPGAPPATSDVPAALEGSRRHIDPTAARFEQGSGVSMSARSGLAERAGLSGQDLGLLSVQFGRRKGAPPMMCLTDRDLRLMALLLDVNSAACRMLPSIVGRWGSFRDQPT